MKLKRMLTITKKEFTHIKRDRASLGIAVMMPIFMLLLFGFAVKSDVNNINFVVYDGSRTSESREIINAFNNSSYFIVNDIVNSPDEVERYIDLGKAKVGMVISSDYTRKIRRWEKAQIQILVDGSDPTVARTAVAYSSLIINHYSAKLVKFEVNKSVI